MSERFPIANALRSTGRAIVLGNAIESTQSFDFATALDEAVFFDTSTAAELYWGGKKDTYRLEEDFGSLLPPFPVCWFEWAVPEEIMLEGKPTEVASVCGQRMAAAVWSEEAQLTALLSDPGTRSRFRAASIDHGIDPDMAERLIVEDGDRMYVVKAVQFVLTPEGEFAGQAQTIPVEMTIGLHSDGTVIPGARIRRMPEWAQSDDEYRRAVEMVDFAPVWMALDLMNCRNVSTRETGSVFRRSGAEKRRGVPVTRFHTIVLPGMSTQYAKTGRATREDRAVMAQHRVRGHFKTYTPEAPLLGRHVGRFWWGWQVRGSKARGEVVADYEVRV